MGENWCRGHGSFGCLCLFGILDMAVTVGNFKVGYRWWLCSWTDEEWAEWISLSVGKSAPKDHLLEAPSWFNETEFDVSVAIIGESEVWFDGPRSWSWSCVCFLSRSECRLESGLWRQHKLWLFACSVTAHLQHFGLERIFLIRGAKVIIDAIGDYCFPCHSVYLSWVFLLILYLGVAGWRLHGWSGMGVG